MSRVSIRLKLNGEQTELSFPTHKTLLEVLREEAGLTGTKHGCELGECGACTVLLNDVPVLSCLRFAFECDGAEVRTVESLTDGARLSPLQEAFADHGGSQCGYCTGGVLMSATALLEHNPTPSRTEIQDALAGNLCRCTGYQQIVEAVEDAVVRVARAAQGGA